MNLLLLVGFLTVLFDVNVLFSLGVACLVPYLSLLLWTGCPCLYRGLAKYELYYRVWKVFVVNVYLLVGWLRVVFARLT